MAPLNPGFWEPTTSTLDWCERNYEVSYYVAEFWNTITNIIYFIPSLVTYQRLRGDRRIKLGKLKHILACYLIQSLVGVGSVLFHGTLKYPTQLMDELPMLFGISYALFLILVLYHPELDRALKTSLFLLSLTSSLLYVVIKIPLFHQTLFALETFLVAYFHLRAVRDLHGDAKLVGLFFLFNIIAFTFWNLDIIYCPKLDRARAGMSTILKPWTQFHGLWHIFTGIGFYLIATHLLLLYLRQINPKHSFKWDYLGVSSVSLEP